MRRLLAVAITAAVLAAGLVLSWGPGVEGATAFPYKTEQDVAAAAENAIVARCPGVDAPGFVIATTDITPGYWWQVSILGQKFIAIEARDTTAVQVVFGRIVDGRLVVVHALTVDQARAKYPEPCAWLASRDA